MALAIPGWTLAQGSTPAPTLGPDKTAIAFAHTIGAAKLPTAQTINIRSTPAGQSFTLAVTGPAPHAGGWLLPSVFAGRAPQAVTLNVNPTGLPAGTYTATVTVTGTTGSPAPSGTTTVTLVVGTPAPTITVSPTTLSFAYTTGQAVAGNPALNKSFILSNNGSAIPATVAIQGATWLRANPTGNITLVGLLNTISVSVDPTGLQPKTYTGTIKIDSKQASNATVTIAVTLIVQAAVPSISGTWPTGVIQQSPAVPITLNGANFFSTSTVAASGFTSATTVTATDGTNSSSEIFYIPIYPSTTTSLRIAMGSPLPAGTVGSPYAAITLQAAGGASPYSWAVTGTLPPGLALNANQISGTPTAAGSYYFTVAVSDATASAYMPMKMTVLPAGVPTLPRVAGPTAVLPAGTVGTAYPAAAFVQAVGGAGALTLSATNVPAGLTLNPTTGAITGTPTSAGTIGPLTATVVSDRAMLATIPAGMLASPGILRVAVTTPAPGGGTSGEAQFMVYGPEPQISAVVNSANFSQGKLSPGEIVTIFGLGLGPSTPALFDPSTGTLPTSLPDTGPATSITFNTTAAPVLFTASGQITTIVPYEVTGPNVDVRVTYGGNASQSFTVAYAAVNPALYTTNGSGTGQGAILNVLPSGDYVLNSGQNPAAKGQTVVLYLTGAGTTTDPTTLALVPASPAVAPTASVTVTIGGQSATVVGIAAPPGSVPGLIQLNVTVPTTSPTGQAIPVVVNLNGVDCQTGVTMAVK